MTSAYDTARSQGYSDEEIMDYFQSSPKYSEKINRAKEQGYSPEEIGGFLKTYNPKKNQEQEQEKPERGMLEKAGRVAGQYGLGLMENALLPYELATMPLTSKSGMTGLYREEMQRERESLLEKKAMHEESKLPEEEQGFFRKLLLSKTRIENGQHVTKFENKEIPWTEKDQEFLDFYNEKLNRPPSDEEIENAPTADIGSRALLEKATGLNLEPEGLAEKSAHFIGFIKNPKKLSELAKTGFKPTQVLKAISPTGTEMLRGTAGVMAYEEAANGGYGPIAQMAALVAGDLIGGGVAGVVKGISSPKKSISKAIAIGKSIFTPKDKLKLQKDIIKEFRESGIQADLGSITDSNLIKWTQARVAQSGFTGKHQQEFMKKLTDDIKEEYKTLADSMGQSVYSTQHQAGEIVKEGIKVIRDSDLIATRKLYENATKSLKENASVESRKLHDAITKLEKDLKPGAIKSSEQQAVLNTVEKLKRDLVDSEGNLLYAKVKDLMNNKIAINDIINYEIQGGAKQLLKGLVGEIDRAIVSHGKENATFAKNYVNANKKFSEHAKTFRNKPVNQILNSTDPSQILNRMGSISGIRQIGNILNKTPQGKEIFNNFKRLKLDKVVGDNLIDSTTQQAKLGTFSKLLENGKNREVVRELLGPKAYNRLVKLQNNAGKLADAVNKFYNASKSGVVAADAAIIAKAMADIANLLSGNPWPLVKTAGGIVAARKLSKLLADETFLKLTEDAILASESGIQIDLIQAFERLKPYILKALEESNEKE